VTSIIAQSAIEKQAWLISKFIRLALDQLKIRNYNGVAEITSALNSRHSFLHGAIGAWSE